MELWVPEVGGAVDPDNEAHELVMSVFGGMSKGERNRIKLRVRSAMASQAELEGRFLGGRPPYGYKIVEAGVHPNPAKAAEGRRLHVLAVDDAVAPIVQRIFAEYVSGIGIYAIAEDLTRDGIPCPSAYDPARNTHRSGIAWSKGAVRTILQNPRYTGFQVWNRQRTDEILLDIDDVALGYTAKMRWNPQDRWIRYSCPNPAGTPPRPGGFTEPAANTRGFPHSCGPLLGQWATLVPCTSAGRRLSALMDGHDRAHDGGGCRSGLPVTGPTGDRRWEYPRR